MTDRLNDDYMLEDCFLTEAEQENPSAEPTQQGLEQFISDSSLQTDGEEKKSQRVKSRGSLAFSMEEDSQTLAEFFVEPDGLAASIRLYPPRIFGKRLTVKQVLQALSEHEIVWGIEEKKLTRLIQNPLYERSIPFAKGVPPTDGKDGRLFLCFDPERKKTAPLKESKDGGVNFRELGFGNIVTKGATLCQILPPERGKPGKAITGKPIAGKDGKPVVPSLGSNTRLSEDGRKIIAACNGEGVLRNGRVCVDRTMTVQEVNSSTGNISFLGTVKVEGNVCQGFSVRATGNIIVKGMAENAFLTAGGSITVEGGINSCLGKGVTAEGDVYAKYIENSIVNCHGKIIADEILNSSLVSDEMVLAQGKKGCLIGGTCRTMQVKALTIGNPVDVPTRIEIDLPLSLFREQESIDQKKSMLRAEKNKLLREQKNMTEEELEETQSAAYRLQWAEQEIDRREKKLEKEEADLRKRKKMGVFVKNTLHRNVTVSIESVRMVTREEASMCAVVRDKTEVVIESSYNF